MFMEYKNNCLICNSSEQLMTVRWKKYNVIYCNNCGLDYCPEMLEKEIGGDSSPVHLEGIKMMADVYFKTSELAMNYTKKRKKVYEELLGNKCKSVLEVGCGPGVFYKPWDLLNINLYVIRVLCSMSISLNIHI